MYVWACTMVICHFRINIVKDKNWLFMWDFKFSWRREWCSELSSGLYCRVKWLSTDVSEVRTASIIRDEWWWRQYAPLKRRLTIILHGSITQKITLNIGYSSSKIVPGRVSWPLCPTGKLFLAWEKKKLYHPELHKVKTHLFVIKCFIG
jgi:hypothetical protein